MLKVVKILEKLTNSLEDNDGYIRWDCDIEFLYKVRGAIKELEELERNHRDCSKCIHNYKEKSN